MARDVARWHGIDMEEHEGRILGIPCVDMYSLRRCAVIGCGAAAFRTHFGLCMKDQHMVSPPVVV